MTAEPLPIQIRPACSCDLPALVSLAALCTAEERRYPAAVLEYMAHQPSCRVFVAQNGTVVGFVVVHKLRGAGGEIVTIDVAPNYRNREIATALMLRGEEWLAANGATSIFLEVDRHNEPATALYLKMGYVGVEEFEEDGLQRVLMQKLVRTAGWRPALRSV